MNSRPVSACSNMLSWIYLMSISLYRYKVQTISSTGYLINPERLRIVGVEGWLSGARVKIIVSVTHFLVVEPSYYYYNTVACLAAG